MARQNFTKIKGAYTKLGKGNVRLTQSNLFLVQTISPTKTTYTFPVLETETTGILADEIRLNINDEFITTHVGIYLRGQVTDEAGVTTPILHTYAPVQLDSNFIVANDLYNGFMRIAVNNINYVDKWGIKKHEYRSVSPQFQQGSILVGGVATLQGTSTMPTARFEADGVYDCSPMVTLSGAKKNEVTIVLPRAISQCTGAWNSNQGEAIEVSITSIAINLFGYLAQNGAKFQ